MPLTLKNFYKQGWEPGANTMAYYPLDSVNTVNDLSGNNRNGTKTSSVSFGTYAGVDCCNINNGQIKASLGTNIICNQGCTINIYYCEYNTPQYDNGGIATFSVDTNIGSMNGLLRANGWPNSKYGICGFIRNSNEYTTALSSVTQNIWYNICLTYQGTEMKLYINGNLYTTGTVTDNYGNRGFIHLGRTDLDSRSIRGYLSRAIFENKARTDTEISDYYNQTKSLYVIS